MPSLQVISQQWNSAVSNKAEKSLAIIFKEVGRNDGLPEDLILPAIKALGKQEGSSGFILKDVGSLSVSGPAPDNTRKAFGVLSRAGSASSSAKDSTTKVAASSYLVSRNSVNSTQKKETHVEKTQKMSFTGVLNDNYNVTGTVSGHGEGSKAIAVEVVLKNGLKSEVDDLYGPSYFRSAGRFCANFGALYLVADVSSVKYKKIEIPSGNQPAQLYVLDVKARADELWDDHVVCARRPLASNDSALVFKSLMEFKREWGDWRISRAFVEIRLLQYQPEDEDLAGETDIPQHDEIAILFKGSVETDAGKWGVAASVPRNAQLLQFRGAPELPATNFALQALDKLMATKQADCWRSMIPEQIDSGWVAKNYDGTDFCYCRSISLKTNCTTSVGLSLTAASLELHLVGKTAMKFEECVLNWLITSPDDDSKTMVHVQCDANVTIANRRFEASIKWKPKPHCHAVHEVTGTQARDAAVTEICRWFADLEVDCQVMSDLSEKAYQAWTQMPEQQALAEEQSRFCLMLELRGVRASVYWTVDEFEPEQTS